MKAHVTMLAALTAVVLAACAGDTADQDDAADASALDTTSAAGTPEALPPDDGDAQAIDATLAEWTITLSQDSVPAGVIAFNVRNTGSVPHAFEVEGNGEEWETDNLAPGADVTMSISLAAGEYRVYCPIEAGGTSHADRGMSTTLRVY